MARLLAWMTVLVVLLSGVDGQAHVRSTSYSWWRFDGDVVTVRWSLSARDLTALRELDATSRLKLEGACQAGAVTVRPDDAAQRTLTWEIRCEHAPRRIVVDALFDAIPGHVHFAQVQREGETDERVLSADHRSIALQSPQDAVTSWMAYLRIGVSHVFGGLDHLVFLLALALLVRSRRQLFWLVSGFTVGHAISMSLVVLGVVSAHGATVEALIGASILILGVEIVWRQRREQHLPVLMGLGLVLAAAAAGAWRGSVRPFALVGLAVMSACYMGWRWRRRDAAQAEPHLPHPSEALLTVTFGAVHGLGFASALGVLSTERVVVPLVAFNVGVELAQVAVVLAACLILHGARRLERDAWVVQLGASTATCAGVFWLLVRVLSGP